MRIENSIDISAPVSAVWALTIDVETWPLISPTFNGIERLESGKLKLGSEVQVERPAQPARAWTVTALDWKRRFTWDARVMGVKMTASHVLTATDEGTRNTLAVDIDGPLSSFVGALVRVPISKAIATENLGFKTAAEGLTTEMGRWRTFGLSGRRVEVPNVDKKAHSFQFVEMTPDEADAYLIRHLEVADDVIATFRDRLVSITGISSDLFDYSDDTVGQIWEAVKPLWTKLEIDEYGFGDDKPPLWYHPNDPGTSRLPHHLWWIRDGLMHYTSRCLMAQSPSLRWEIERDRFGRGFNQPKIVGFDGASVHPIVDAFGMAGSVLRGDRPGDPEPVDRFMSAYRLKAARAPGPGEPAFTPPVDDRYVREDVVVTVALLTRSKMR